MASPDIYRGIDIPPVPAPLVPIKEPSLIGIKKPEDYALPSAKAGFGLRIAEAATNLRLQIENIPDVVLAPNNVEADLAFPAHSLARQIGRSPVEIAKQLAAEINGGVTDHRALAVNGFVNFNLDRTAFAARVLGEVEGTGKDYGHQNIGEGKTVVIDYSSPNTAKPMSVAHLRSTAIGWSLALIYEATGHRVITDNHIGDWGTQFGILGLAYEKWKDEIPELRDNRDPIKGLFALYVHINDEIEKEKAPIRAPLQTELDSIEDKKSRRAREIKQQINKIEAPLEQQGKAWFRKLEEGDEEARRLLSWALQISAVELDKVYDLLGSKFNYVLGESEYVGMIPSILEELRRRGVTSEINGEVSVSLEDRGLDDLPIKTPDGRSLYSTRDLGTLIARDKWFNPAEIIYVVGSEQGGYFEQVFAAFDKITDGVHPQLTHVGFGEVKLPQGKMSTRRGRVIFLQDLLDESVIRARQRIDRGGTIADEDQKARVARQVGVGAVVFSDLGESRRRNITFDLDAALDLSKQTAPSVQYAGARTQAILDRAESEGVTINNKTLSSDIAEDREFDLIKQLAAYPEAVNVALAEKEPSRIAQSILEIAAALNHLHQNDRVFSTSKVYVDDDTRNTRLRLIRAAGQVIKNGLGLLGIEAPSKM